MCGIVGGVAKYASGFSQQAVKCFEDLLFMDTLRGPDSTGTFVVDKWGNVNITKEIGEAAYTLYDPDYHKKVSDVAYKEGKILVGHNRKATVGKVTIDNAHPFVVNNELVLVHNGSLNSHKHLGDTEVDSHAIAQYIHEHWKDDAEPLVMSKLFQHIGGAFALVWYDLRTGKLNIVRNNQRPLFIAESDSAFFWASEKEMLLAAMARNNLTTKSCISVDPLKFYSFDITEASGHETKVKEVVLPTIPFPVTTKKGKPPHIPHKQSILSTAISNGMGGADNAGDDDSVLDELSKAKFKRYVKQLIGKTITFTVEDFVSVANKDSQEWFYGINPDYAFNHEVIGTCPTSVAQEVIENKMNGVGTITNATYIKSERKICIAVELLGSPVAILTH